MQRIGRFGPNVSNGVPTGRLRPAEADGASAKERRFQRKGAAPNPYSLHYITHNPCRLPGQPCSRSLQQLGFVFLKIACAASHAWASYGICEAPLPRTKRMLQAASSLARVDGFSWTLLPTAPGGPCNSKTAICFCRWAPPSSDRLHVFNTWRHGTLLASSTTRKQRRTFSVRRV